MKWDKLFLIIASNIFIAASLVSLFQDRNYSGFAFLAVLGVMGVVHFWRGGRFIIHIQTHSDTTTPDK